jgi:GT2 family glycosyltransferase
VKEFPPEMPIVAPAPSMPIEPAAAAPTISVVVPAYEAAATIAEAIESVLAQDPPPHELIVSDDGSHDDLDAALAPFEGRITILRLQHRGVAAARNAGWRAGGGDFVLYADADDTVLPGKIAALQELGRMRPDLDMLATDMYFERDGERSGRFGEVNSFPVEDQRPTVLERCFVVQPAFRRARLEEIGGFDEALRSAEDWDCILRLVLAGSAAGLYDAPLAVYRIRTGSLSGARAQSLRDRVRILEKASENPRLRPEERPALERSLAAQRRRATVAEAQDAVASGRPDARRRCLRVAMTAGAPARARLWGIAVALLPGRLRWWAGHGLASPAKLSRNLPTGTPTRP